MLDLSNNELSSLPENIAHLTSLVHLELRHNSLTSIPVGIERIDSLRSVSLGEEQLKYISRDRLAIFKNKKIQIN